MSSSGDGDKPAQTGLVDMGNISFYNNSSSPLFNLAEVAPYQGSFSELVLNVTWAQLQATEGGPLTTSAIDSAISQVNAYNAANGTNLGLKLRVWGGFTAPDWAKNIDGPPITIDGESNVDPTVFTPQTIGRVWTADYIDAWTSLQNALAARYDSNPVIRGISQTAGAAASDEPFVPLMPKAKASAGSTSTVNQIAELQAGGYNDAAEMLTLRAAIADYSQWSTTPLDFTMNSFYQFDSGSTVADATFALAVLQQARNSTRLVQAGNHALRNPLYSFDTTIYGQLAADAALDPAVAPNSFQTASPVVFFPTYADWQAAIAAGVTLDAGNIELWDFPGTRGFTGLSPSQVQGLAAILAAGSPPPTVGSPDDGSALGFIAPAFATGTAGTAAFSGTNAVLLASVTPQAAYSVTLRSLAGGTLGFTDVTGTLIGVTSGPVVTLSGTLDLVNTVLAHLTDTLQGGTLQGGTLQSGTDIVQIVATDSSGNTAVRNVGVQISQPAASTTGATPGLLPADQTFAFGGGTARVVGQGQAGNLDTAAQLGNSGIVIVGGVQSALSVAGNLDVSGSTTLLAALSPAAYSTASLTIGGTLEVQGGAAARFTGSLGANTVTVDTGGVIDAAGTLAATGGGPIVNNGTIEAMADQTLGLQRLNVTNDISNTTSGTLLIDAGATLRLGGAVASNQTIQFAPPSIAQLANDPYSPSTLVLGEPSQARGAAITGFTFADSLVLEGVTATSAGYAGSTLTVNLQGGGSLSYNLTGNLAGLTPQVSSGNTITFVAAGAGVAPSVVAPGTLEGAAGAPVLVPNVVVETPLPASPPSTQTFTVTVKSGIGLGLLSAGDDNGNVIVGGNHSTTLTLTSSPSPTFPSGSLGAIERALQTLTYTGVSGHPNDTITISATDYFVGPPAPDAVIQVHNNSASLDFTWTGAASNSFADPQNWSASGGGGLIPPGGTNVAQFGPGAQTVSGDGAVGELSITGTTTLTGQVTAQGHGGVALDVDSGGALMLAGGAVLTAQAQATVGSTGQGLFTLMGGALALTGGSSTTNALVIGQQAGSNGTVLNLEQIAANGSVVVGAAGTGTLELLGVASTVLDGGADIGQSAGGQGNVIVNGGEWMTSGQLAVGDAGTGSLLIDGMDNGTTGQATAFNATVGANAGSQGSVTLDGGELLVANAAAASSTLAVGAGGAGSLEIENGSEVTVGAAEATLANNTNVTDTGLLTVGGTAGGNGRIDLGWLGMLLVCGNSAVGGAAGAGAVTVGDGADDTASFATTGTLAIGATGQVTLGGANATVRAGTIDIAAGGLVSGAGTISGDGGGNNTVALVSIDNESSITASGGNLLLYGEVTGTGTLAVTAGATMTLQAAVGGGQTLAFSPNARAVLNDARAFAGTITGFGAGDVLDIAGTDASSAVWSDGVLTLGTAFGAIRLLVSGNYASNGFTVQSDGLGGTNVTGGIGDVHMTAFDGLRYDFQALGDFVAVRSTEPASPWLIEIRTATAPGATSITTELAAQLGDDRVTFAVGRANPVYIDGAPDTTLQVGAAQSLADGTLARLSSAAYRLTWNTGESLTVAVTGQGGWLDWSVGLGPQDGAGSVQGLLGSNSGQATDFQLPNGSVLPQPLSSDQILGGFADAWRVAPGASLFDDKPAPAAPGTALLLQYMSAMGDNAGAASHDLNATLPGAVSPSADHLFAAAAPSSPFHG
jgi:T5SS/PEP-CTERM-associated repeat protein